MMDNKIMSYEDWLFIGRYIDKSHWIFAKTMAANPHYYTLRKESVDSEFVRFVELIRKYGFKMKYGRAYYTCLRVNEWYYWTMGCPLHNCPQTGTILVNRKECKLVEESPYDEISKEYSEMFGDEYSKDEEIQIANMIAIAHNTTKSVLEIGVGVGSITKNLILDGGAYLGVEPSFKCIELAKSAPELKGLDIIHTDFESFYVDRKFDFIFASFGAASYVRPEFWERLPKLLNESGSYYLMFYADGYVPKTHMLGNIDIPFYSVKESGLNCKLSQYGDYVIAEGFFV
jgi:hypothetical protein